MKDEQFIYWLKGFLEAKEVLEKEHIDIIKEKINNITNSTPYPFVNPRIELYDYNKYPTVITHTGPTSIMD